MDLREDTKYQINMNAGEDLPDFEKHSQHDGEMLGFGDGDRKENQRQRLLGNCQTLPTTPLRGCRRNQTVSGGSTLKELASENGRNGSMREREGAGPLGMLTRPSGGRRCLYMDREEVKACRELGFELEAEEEEEEEDEERRHRREYYPLERIITTRLWTQDSGTPDTSSGGNSPIPSWRISSPGDDPRDVKARLKVWAQAVAQAYRPP